MRLLQSLQRTISTLLTRSRFERDLRDELRAHIANRAADLVKTGLAPADAERAARLEFGAIEAYKEQCRDAGGMAPFRPLLGLGGDLKLAARRLAATPLFFAFAVLSLALGIAVTTTAYSVLYALLWKPLGVRDPARVAVVTSTVNGWPMWRGAMSLADFESLRDRQRSLGDLAASAAAVTSIDTPRASELLSIEAVSATYFNSLGLYPSRGRVIQPDDETGGVPVVVLSDTSWRRDFHSDPAIVGKAVRIGSQPFEIVGVLQHGYEGLHGMGLRPVTGWVPLSTADMLMPRRVGAEASARIAVTVVGRLTTGHSVTTAAAELAAIGSSLDTSNPARVFRPLDGSTVARRRGWSVENVTTAARPPVGAFRFDYLLLFMTLLVLLVACTNLANLLLSRGTDRLHEISVRCALGAARWRLVRELLAESALIAAAGAVATYYITRAFLALATMDIPLSHTAMRLEPELSLPALVFASAALLIAVLVFGLEPAVNLTRQSVNGSIVSDAGVTPPRRAARQRSLIRWQVAISACFFTIAAVLTKAVVTEARNDSGIALERLALTTLHFGAQGWEESRARRAIDRTLSVARTRSEIRSVSVSTGLPFGFQMTSGGEVTTTDRPFVANARANWAVLLAGSPDLLRTLAVPLLRGRQFTDADDAGAPPVAIVSELTERRLFGTVSAIDRQILIRDRERKTIDTVTIVGVAKPTDVDALMQRRGELIYLPFAQRYRANVVLVANASGDVAAAVRALQSSIREADPDLAAGTSGPAYWLTAGPYVAARMAAGFASALGLLTLILAMIGLYGVLTQAVANRTREVGVRMALGAGSRDIERMVLRQGTGPVLQGVVIGLLLGTVARGLIRALLAAPVQIVDPFTLIAVPVPLAVAALIACYLPARRAAQVDPNVALRHL